MSESQQTPTKTPTAPADGLQPDGGMGPHIPTDANATSTSSTGSNTAGGTKITPDGGMGPH